MGFFSCNTESSVIACDSYNWDTKKKLKKKKKKRSKSSQSYKTRGFSYTDLEAATGGFSPDCFLGKGSHGSVYKAVLNNGKLVVAVKKSTLTRNSDNITSPCTVPPGENEIEILSNIQNPRFVNLLGYCYDSDGNKLIVVEYMANGSLFDLLHSNIQPPDWPKRVRFALQIARAVEALHSSNPPVIHRDIKSSNVLIDGDWNARLGDFGLALRGNVEDMKIKCTPPAGTLGYLDPAYIAPDNLSVKSDVFSFGILLLEIISGRNAIDVNFSPPFVVEWALPLIKHGEFVAIFDPRIDLPDDLLVLQQLAILAVKCVRSMAEKRPSMSEIVESLRIADKCVSSPMWNNLRRQSWKQSLSSTKQQLLGTGKEVVKTSRYGNRISSSRTRKVTNIQLSLTVDFRKDSQSKIGVRVGRSNSIGTTSEINKGSDTGLSENLPIPLPRKSAVAVKLPAAKLNKSRSLGVLRSTRLAQCQEKRFVLQVVKSPQLRQLDVSRLVLSVDQALQNNITERKESTA